jgi:hypothetical protein
MYAFSRGRKEPFKYTRLFIFSSDFFGSLYYAIAFQGSDKAVLFTKIVESCLFQVYLGVYSG